MKRQNIGIDLIVKNTLESGNEYEFFVFIVVLPTTFFPLLYEP